MMAKGAWQWKSNEDPWSKSEEPKWKSYSLEHNYLIEKAYYERQKEVDLGDYLVYPLKMVQRKKGNLNAQRPIRRINWTNNEKTQDRSARYFETEVPKTINRIFGGLEDFISFFSRRNPEILDFTSHFNDLEKSNDLEILNQAIIPKLVQSLEEVLLKPNKEQLKESSLSQLKKKMLLKIEEKTEGLIFLFKKEFLSIEGFYEQIFKAYTMNTDLYPILNNALRNESWVEVDKLLPYAFCLCKAFFNETLKTKSAQASGILESKTLFSIFLFRGTAFDEFTLSFYNKEKVQYFSWNSVTSTSKNNEIAEKFMYKNADIPNKKYPVKFVIEIPLTGELKPEYLKWIDIHRYSAVPMEDEVILPPGSVFELIEVSTDKDKKITIKLKLRNEIKSLAHGGMMMQGALQSQMMTEKEMKIVCLEGEELDQALMSLCGNKLVEGLEFCLCTFDKKLLSKMFEILSTLKKIKILRFIACKYEGKRDVSIKRLKYCGITKIEVTEANDFFQVICNKKCNLENLVSLRELDLDFRSRRNLSDEELTRTVSQRLECFSQLTYLDINFERCRQITDHGVNSLAQRLKSLTQLTHLNINFTECRQLTDQGVNDLVKGFNSLNRLIDLNLGFNWCKQITDKGVDLLATRLKYTSQLTSLNLGFGGCEQITDKGVIILSKLLNSLTQLAYLQISFKYCKQITDEGVDKLASQALKHLIQLTSLILDFSGCSDITSKGVHFFWSQGLECLHELRSLDLAFGFVTDPMAKSLTSQGLRNLTQLTSLTLDYLNYNDEELESFISDGLKHLLQLRSLILPFYQDADKEITDKGLAILAFQGLKFMTSLTKLELHFNRFRQITDKGIACFASQGLSNLTKLTSLALHFLNCQQITHEGVSSLMSQGLKDLIQLTSLTLNFTDCMQITGKGLDLLASHWLKHLIPFESLRIMNRILWTESKRDIRVHPFGSSSKVKLARENSQTEKQPLDKELLVSFSENCPLKMTLNSTGSEKLLSQNFLDTVIPILKKNENRTCTLKVLEIFFEIRHLISLNLDFERHRGLVNNEFVHHLASQVLRHFPQLRSLTLLFNECNQITDEGVGDLALYGLKPLVNLASLNLDFCSCKQITDRGVIDLAQEGLRHLSQLKCLTLNFGLCDKMTDEGLISLTWNGLRHLSQLESLVLRPHPEVTDKGIDGLASQGLKYLTQLESLTFYFFFASITDKGVNNLILRIVKNLPQLIFLCLEVDNCRNVSNLTIRNVIKVLHYFGFTRHLI